MTAWNDYHEKLIKKWSLQAKTYSIMHSISSEYYNNWDKRLGIPVILLGAISASSIFTTSSQSSNIWSYINGGMVLLMTGISGISKFLGTNEKIAKHTSASFKYTEISMNIDTILSFTRSDREENPKEFINKIKTSILEAREHAPDLPTWVISSWINKLDKSIVNTTTNINDAFETIKQIEQKENSSMTDVKLDESSDYMYKTEEKQLYITENKRVNQLEIISEKLNMCNSQDDETENDHMCRVQFNR